MAQVRVGLDGVGHITDTGYTPGIVGGVVEVMNMTGQPTLDLHRDIMGRRGMDPEMAMLQDAMMAWHQRTFGNPNTGGRSRAGGILERDVYVSPGSYYGKIQTARTSLSDDVVGNAADMSEFFALARTSMLCTDEDSEDVWDQIAADIELTKHLKAAWRVLFTDSASVTAIWWGRKTYKPRGSGEGGRERRRQFDLTVPLALSLLDTAKVVPVGQIHFGQESLAYQADMFEAEEFDKSIAARDEANQIRRDLAFDLAWMSDPNATLFLGAELASRLIMQRYIPNPLEAYELQRDGITDVSNLFLLNPRAVFRHTLTRPPFRRFPDVRLDRIFPLLDLKNQLRHSDRTHLIGGANMIILITKGTDAEPADQAEVDDLRRNAHVLASMPIITSDHRLKVEIITPRLDTTLQKESHDTLDARLFASTFNTFVPTGADANDDPIKLGRVIAQALQGRRNDLASTYENQLCERIRVLNDPKLVRTHIRYRPRTISLAFDSAMAQVYLDLQENGSASRETTLDQFDMDQEQEALLRQREKERYDELFQPTMQRPGAPALPPAGEPDAPQPTTRQQTRSGGRRGGGNRSGGGDAPGSNQGGRQSPDQIRRRGRGQRATEGDDTPDVEDDDT